MINQLRNIYQSSIQERACINLAKNNWDSKRQCIETLKINLNAYFDFHQRDRCCYCGLLYGATGRGEIDHIAPKGAQYYPEFSYHPKNLAKACQLCNSSSMKHTFDTITVHSPNYDLCQFNIVHPYIDDHTYHYSFRYGFLNVVISVNNNSVKARESIRLFELDSEKRTRARARERNMERLEQFYNITNAMRSRINSILTFKV